MNPTTHKIALIKALVDLVRSNPAIISIGSLAGNHVVTGTSDISLKQAKDFVEEVWARTDVGMVDSLKAALKTARDQADSRERTVNALYATVTDTENNLDRTIRDRDDAEAELVDLRAQVKALQATTPHSAIHQVAELAKAAKFGTVYVIRDEERYIVSIHTDKAAAEAVCVQKNSEGSWHEYDWMPFDLA